MNVIFSKKSYRLILTNHAQKRMEARDISTELLVEIIETGKKIAKERENRFWIFKEVPRRSDNFLCISVAIERSDLVVVTALINWRPNNED